MYKYPTSVWTFFSFIQLLSGLQHLIGKKTYLIFYIYIELVIHHPYLCLKPVIDSDHGGKLHA